MIAKLLAVAGIAVAAFVWPPCVLLVAVPAILLRGTLFPPGLLVLDLAIIGGCMVIATYVSVWVYRRAFPRSVSEA